MHSIKGGWVGQTFALAKCNESGGRKSRIRRSKEERKEMIEYFIKKYQSLNNGSFPSLNLTHKEVGGSFYTVREIVREIIQENRVLGPAKFTEGQNADQLMEQYPLGTISIEPQNFLSVLPNGTGDFNQHQSTTKELDLPLSGLPAEPECQEQGHGKTINGSHVVVESDRSDKPKVAEVVVCELLETEKKSIEKVAASSKVTKMEDVIVETFPIRPVTSSTDYLDRSSGEIGDLHGILEKKEVEKVNSAPGENNNFPDAISNSASNKKEVIPAAPLLECNSASVDEKTAESFVDPLAAPAENNNLPDAISTSVNDKEEVSPAAPLLEISSASVDKKAAETSADPLARHSDSSAIIVNDVEGDIDEKSPLHDKVGPETEVVNAPNSVQTKTTNGATATIDSSKSATREVKIENKADALHSDSSNKGSKPTLDRINIESWEASSRNPAKPDANPLWVFIKSCVDAFVKFWSE